MEKICPGVFGILTLLLLISGAFAPGWLVLEPSNNAGVTNSSTSIKYHYGLFYIYIVQDGLSQAISYSAVDGLSESGFFSTLGFLEYQIEVCIGIVMAFIALVLTWAYKKDSSPSMLIAPIIMYLIASAATWLAVGRFLRAFIVLSFVIGMMGVPYSIILSGLGALFCFILMITLIVMYIQHRRTRTPPQQGVVFADVPMATAGYPQNRVY